MSASSEKTGPPGSSAGTPQRVVFTADAKDPTTELFLIDARLQRVARGTGKLETEQPPGVYKLKLRAGPSTQEELIILRDRPVHHHLDRLHFASAVPLAETAQTHEYQQEAARKHSDEKAQVQLGHGSFLFVFARDWTPGGSSPLPGHHPAEALTLRSLAGEQLVDFRAASVANLHGDAWSACRVELTPGIYRLAVGSETGERFEMAVPAVPQWHTQIFLLQRDDDRRGYGRRPDLGRASLLLSRSPTFNKDAFDDRLAEMAKLALADQRPVVSQELLDILLHRKFENPMLGIFGGHVLLLEPEPRREFLRGVVKNLRDLLGATHPDVEALALACDLGTTYVFEAPPLLRQSWRIVVEKSAGNPGLVPFGSLAAEVATQITSQEPWLIWRRSKSEHDRTERLQGFTEFIWDRVKPLAAKALRGFAKQTNPAKVPVLDELIRSLNLPSTTVAQLLSAAISTATGGTLAKPATRKAPAKKVAAQAAEKARPKATARAAAKKSPVKKVARKPAKKTARKNKRRTKKEGRY